MRCSLRNSEASEEWEEVETYDMVSVASESMKNLDVNKSSLEVLSPYSRVLRRNYLSFFMFQKVTFLIFMMYQTFGMSLYC